MKNIIRLKLSAISFALFIIIVSFLPACNQDSKNVTVMFDANGGECDVGKKTVVIGKQYGQLPEPTNKGFEFLGWYYYPDGSGEQVLPTTVVIYNAKHTLFAHWAQKVYNVNFNLNGGEGTVPDIKVGYGRKYGWLPTGKEVKRDGYYFEGWKTEDDKPVEGDSVVFIPADHTLYAKWTYLDEANKTVMLNDFNSNFSYNPTWASLNSGTQPLLNPAPSIISQTDKKKTGRDRAMQVVLYNNRTDENFRPCFKINKSAFGDNSNINFENVRFLIFDMFLLLEDSNLLSSNLDVIMFTVRLCSGNDELGALGTFLLRPNAWEEIKLNLIRANIENISQTDTIMIEFPNNPHNGARNKNSRITFYLNDLKVITK